MVVTRHQAQREAAISKHTRACPHMCKEHPDPMARLTNKTPPPLLTLSHSPWQDNDPMAKVDTFLENLDDTEVSTMDALMARWPSMHARLKGMKPHLPPTADERPTLVLDLDETLLHTFRNADGAGSKLFLEAGYVIYANDGRTCLAGCLRPGVTEFLTWAAQFFEVVVWTAGHEEYAHMARELLDPDGTLITHMLTRKTCIRMRSASTGDIMYIKDLCALGRDLSRTFLVDNTPHAATLNLSNLIPIESFVGASADTELQGLRHFLENNLTRLTNHRNDMRILLHRQLNLKRRLRERIDHWKKTSQQPPYA